MTGPSFMSGYLRQREAVERDDRDLGCQFTCSSGSSRSTPSCADSSSDIICAATTPYARRGVVSQIARTCPAPGSCCSASATCPSSPSRSPTTASWRRRTQPPPLLLILLPSPGLLSPAFLLCGSSLASLLPLQRLRLLLGLVFRCAFPPGIEYQPLVVLGL